MKIYPKSLLLAGIALFLSMPIALNAQKLPQEIRWSSDGHQLLTGKQNDSWLYDSALVRNVYLQFPQSNYWTLLTNNYASKTDLLASMTIDSVVYDSVGVRFKGNTSYKNLGTSQKKSFNISLDFLREQEIEDYSTLNFNNAFEDASFLKEVFYSHQIRKHIPATKANFIHLYINNQDWGVYPNVQQVNKDLIKEWFFSNDGINWRADSPTGTQTPGWGDGTAALNNLGNDTNQYKKYYTLKSSDLQNPWDSLASVCAALNASGANLETILPNFMDIDRTLWYLASEIAFSDDDSYVYKGKMDYYVYFDPETNRLTPLEFDGNSVMGGNTTTWSPFYNATKVNYPLMNKMFAVPAWRQRYLAHLRTIIQEELDPTACNAILDNYKNQIDTLVLNDPKKIYTYAAFGTGVTALKTWISTRRNFLLANAEVAQIAPTIHYVKGINAQNIEWGNPLSYEAENIIAYISNSAGIASVNLYYSDELTGNFQKILMYDDGNHADSLAADGIYGAAVPGFAAGTIVRYYIEAKSANASGSVSYEPKGAEHDVFAYKVETGSSQQTSLVINEFMASNVSTAADNFAEYDDWIELYNRGTDTIHLGDFFISDNIANLDKWQLPSQVYLAPNEYYIIWADEDSSQGVNHANFKLSALGESIILVDSQINLVDSVSFSAQTADLSWARKPNGTGPFEQATPSFQSNNVGGSTGIQASAKISTKIFPNPANEQVVLWSNEVSDYEIIDALGKTIEGGKFEKMQVLPTSNWTEGLYIIRIGMQYHRLIIQH